MRGFFHAWWMIAALALSPAVAADAPKYEVNVAWPETLPNNWIMGQAAGVAVDGEDRVWVVQRPKTLTDDEKAAALDPPRTKCCKPAPSVLEFDQSGKLLRSWGGPGQGYDWPSNEHGIYVDAQGFVWLAGNGDKDGQILKFTRDGKFVLQIGKPGDQTNSADTSRLGNPVHCVRIARDGLVYVCDRVNDRIQVFRKDGTFVKEIFVEKATRANGSVWDLELFPDADETWLINADGANNEVRLIRRDTGEVVGAFGRSGRNAGEFHWVHNLAIDSKGNVFTTEVDNGKRAQKFLLRGDMVLRKRSAQ